MIHRIKLYLLYRRIKRRGWAKNKNFKEWRVRREWCLNYTPEEHKKYIEYDYETT